MTNSRKMIMTVTISVLGWALLASCNSAKRHSTITNVSGTPWPKVAFHKRTISDGFVLMFDKPLVKEHDGSKVTVLGIGRVTVPQIRLAGVPDYYAVDHKQKMVILLKAECRNTLIANITYSSIQDNNETQRGDWRSNTYSGAGHLEIPGMIRETVYKGNRAIRVEPIVCDLPSKEKRCINPEHADFNESFEDDSIFPLVTTADLSRKPTYEFSRIDQLGGSMFRSGHTRYHFCDWLISNPAFIDKDWRGGNALVLPRRAGNEKFLSLRFYFVDERSYDHSSFGVVAYGMNGERVVLNLTAGGESYQTTKVYTGLDIIKSSTSSNPRFHSHEVGRVDPESPAGKAGIKQGDVIVETAYDPCIEGTYGKDPELGKPVFVKYRRNGTEYKAKIVPEEQPESNIILKGMEKNSLAAFSQLLKGLPHSGNPRVELSIPDGRLGFVIYTSYDPVPADFKLSKIAIYVSGRHSSDPAEMTQRIKEAVDSDSLEMPEIPIPEAFWK